MIMKENQVRFKGTSANEHITFYFLKDGKMRVCIYSSVHHPLDTELTVDQVMGLYSILTNSAGTMPLGGIEEDDIDRMMLGFTRDTGTIDIIDATRMKLDRIFVAYMGGQTQYNFFCKLVEQHLMSVVFPIKKTKPNVLNITPTKGETVINDKNGVLRELMEH